ncbi:WD40 repeat domain-containing protein [Nocardia sp. NPDC059246]|uniref:WD40 repeat domain-containing protein n=1 Tax=unclassified Nocardia TaxID=2637762 RepID=UPI00368DEEE9
MDAVAFHPDGHLLATARHHNWSSAGVRVWNPTTGSQIGKLDTPANAIAFSPDGAFLATADEASGLVRLWDTTGWPNQG